MKARIDYVKNPDKTEKGELISSFACAPETADQEFVLARDQYFKTNGGGKKYEVIAYQLRQSFKPGEVSAEEANQIGYELAERLLQGEHCLSSFLRVIKLLPKERCAFCDFAEIAP